MSDKTLRSSRSVDLTAAPFHLGVEDVEWVRTTIDSMSLPEKIGQLFVNHNAHFDNAYLDRLVDEFHVGGIRHHTAPAAEVSAVVRRVQERAKVPLLVAANIEAGGEATASEGTLVGSALQCASAPDLTASRRMGFVGGAESAAVGCNWSFAPVVDVHYNWRNTVIASRAFGDDPDVVIDHARAYSEGIRDGVAERPMALCAKHFPGDGVDERDQHMVTSVNTMTTAEWDNSFGRIYRNMIEDGIASIMIGHIALPEYSRRLRPEIDRILPATIAPELIDDLLRGQLGFNGLILTDATHMIGFTAALPRRELLPAAVNAGCDMVLFFRDPVEDLEIMRTAVETGVVSAERLDVALQRILGLKASLGLHRAQIAGTLVPDDDARAVVGCDEHRAVAADVADQTVTLVRDTGVLPLDVDTHRRIRLICPPDLLRYGAPPSYQGAMRAELEAAGFEVEDYPPALPKSFAEILDHVGSSNRDFGKSCDAAIVVAGFHGIGRQSSVRLAWSMPFGPEMPWYSAEVPTIFVSLGLPNHLADVPMVSALINAHAPTPEVIHAVVQKILGHSEFRGSHNDKVLCGLTEIL